MTHAPSRGLAPPGRAEEELDPELLDLPDPPKRERTLTVALLLVTAIASLAMVVLLRRDAAYAFAPRAPAELGDLAHTPAASLAENRYVHATVALGAGHAIRYERPFASDSFRLMPVAGRPDVWAEVRVPPGGETRRFVPPAEITGRLVRLDDAGPRHRGLASAVRTTTGVQVPSGAWLLVQGEAPEGARWAVLLELMFLGFAVWNVLVTAKLLKRVS